MGLLHFLLIFEIFGLVIRAAPFSSRSSISPFLTSASLALLFLLLLPQIDSFGKKNFALFGLLDESVLGNRLEGLLDVDCLLGARLEVWNVSFGLAPAHCPFLGDNALVVKINLVAEDDEGERIGLSRAGVDKKFVAPRVEVLERLGHIYIEHQHAAVGPAIEGDAERLKPFLASRVPYLHGHEAVVDHHLLGEKVGSDRRFVLVAEFLVDILVHQRGLADTAVSKNNDFQKDFFSRRHVDDDGIGLGAYVR